MNIAQGFKTVSWIIWGGASEYLRIRGGAFISTYRQFRSWLGAVTRGKRGGWIWEWIFRNREFLPNWQNDICILQFLTRITYFKSTKTNWKNGFFLVLQSTLQSFILFYLKFSVCVCLVPHFCRTCKKGSGQELLNFWTWFAGSANYRGKTLYPFHIRIRCESLFLQVLHRLK